MYAVLNSDYQPVQNVSSDTEADAWGAWGHFGILYRGLKNVEKTCNFNT